MGKRAKTTVVLSHPHKGGVHVFVEGDQLPDWALGEITNPEIVDLDDSGTSDKPAAKPRTRAPRRAPAKAPAKAAATAKTDDAKPPAGDGTDAKE